MKNIEKHCSRCLMNYTALGRVTVNFCQKCGKLLEISAEGEQPFHLPEDEDFAHRIKVEKNIRALYKILDTCTGLPDVFEKSLRECAELLKEMEKPEEKCWDDPKWFDKIKKLKF